MNEDRIIDWTLRVVAVGALVACIVLALALLCLFTAPWWIVVWFDPLMIAFGAIFFVLLVMI